MSRHVGLERSAEALGQALEIIERLERDAASTDLLNMLAAARLVTTGALARMESRGAHWRSDFRCTEKQGARSFMTLAEARAGESVSRRKRAQS
jgi:L-aspartate oxidase